MVKDVMLDVIKRLKNMINRRHGFGLIEVLVGIALISLVGTAGLSALSSISRINQQSSSRTMARSIAVSQMDAVSAASYIYAPAGGLADYSFVPPDSNYSISSLDRSDSQVDSKIYGVPWDVASSSVYNGSNPIDPGIQKITIIVAYKNKEILRVVNFKVNR
jgi:prepilin-type N-terminal cleavage/methylation domain-containing protein